MFHSGFSYNGLFPQDNATKISAAAAGTSSKSTSDRDADDHGGSMIRILHQESLMRSRVPPEIAKRIVVVAASKDNDHASLSTSRLRFCVSCCEEVGSRGIRRPNRVYTRYFCLPAKKAQRKCYNPDRWRRIVVCRCVSLLEYRLLFHCAQSSASRRRATSLRIVGRSLQRSQ